MAPALLLASYSYCFSDTTYGVTQNAAIDGLNWSMKSILPDATSPYVTIQVNGLTYSYTMVKDPTTDSIVYVRTEDVEGGYAFQESDDWSGRPGGNITKVLRLPYIDSARLGNGSIDVDGDGQIVDPSVTYNYKMDIDEQLMLCAASPLADPSCPGFREALAAYLASLSELSPSDPFYDEWVQANLSINDETEEPEQQEQTKEPEENLSNFEKEMGGENSIGDLVDLEKQARLMAALAQTPKIESYYVINIPGGEYTDALVLEDTTLPDNPRAMRSLASDANHKKMVRSQYDREQ